MRQIGIAGLRCFDGPCEPWSKRYPCSACAVRPMKVYAGNISNQRMKNLAKEHGFGVMISARYRTLDFTYFAIDNGAFSAWKNNKAWDEELFMTTLHKYHHREKRAPDFVVVPDVVANGEASYQLSIEWIEELRGIFGSWTRYYLAVQDGMTIEDTDRDPFDGIFVGGTLRWKYKTAEDWVRASHDDHKPCHIGRVGTFDKIVWAARIGADGIDSSSWPRHNSFYKIFDAQKQSNMEGYLR